MSIDEWYLLSPTPQMAKFMQYFVEGDRPRGNEHANVEMKVLTKGEDRTHMGQVILALNISIPSETGEKKPVMWVDSLIHSNEWLTGMTSLYFAHQVSVHLDELSVSFTSRLF